MKKISKLLIGSMLASSVVLAAPKPALQVELGITNISLDSTSETGTTIKLRNGKDQGFNIELSHTSADTFSVNEFGGNYNIKLSDKLYAGANLTVVGVALSGDSSSETSFSGVTYGIQGRYKLSDNQGLDLVYKIGSVTDSTGFLDLDLSTTSLMYSYRF